MGSPVQYTKLREFLPGRGLIWQLFIVTILPLTVLVLAITFGSLSVHQQAMRMMVGERDARAVRTAATALQEQLKHRVFSVRSLSLRAQNADPADIPHILSASDYLLADFGSGLAFFQPDGVLVASTGDQELWTYLEGRITPLLAKLLDSSAPPTYISSTITHPKSTDRMVIFLALSESRDWIAAGASTAADMVHHTLSNAFTASPEVSVIVIDADQGLLYSSGSYLYSGVASAHPGAAEALRGESGTIYIQDGSNEHVVTHSPVAPVGWALVLEEPWDMVASPTLRSSQVAPLVVVPVLFLTLLALWFGLRQIVQPLQKLEAKAATLAAGDFNTIEQPVGGIPEIRHLQVELVNMAHKVQAAQKGMHDYIGAITAAQEDERQRMARELHDDTIQALIALKQRVQLTQLALGENLDISSFTEIASLTEQTIENLRRLTRALRPIYLEDLGLVTALEMLVRETSQNANIPVEFQRQGAEVRLPPNIELALYRMAQEALSNVTRHAQASRASLSIEYLPQEVMLQVTDNGVGFRVPVSPAEFAPSGHFGLLGLHERAELIGARLDIQASPGEGSRVAIHLTV